MQYRALHSSGALYRALRASQKGVLPHYPTSNKGPAAQRPQLPAAALPGKSRLSCVAAEPNGSKSSRKSGKSPPSGDSGRSDNPELLSSGLIQELRSIPSKAETLKTTWASRAASFSRESTLLLYSALIDNTLVVALEWLKVDRLLKNLQPTLEKLSATLFGSYHELPSGRRIPFSLVNNTGPDMSIPAVYLPSKVATVDESAYDSKLAHFMAMCMKLAYEDAQVVQDVAEREWGLRFGGYFQTAAEAETLYDVENQKTADFIPRTRACALLADGTVIIAFRGSEPLNLINLRSSGKITMRTRFEFGKMHDGFHAGLFHSDPEMANSLYSQLVSRLKDPDVKGSKILLSGHSLGGALAAVFAAALASKEPELAAQVRGLYTFGMPRVGDADFCKKMEAAFPGRCHRITHAADIIPLVPPRFLEYSHFGEEHYLTSLGREVLGSADISRARQKETLGSPLFYIWKLVAGLLLNPKEGSLRTIYRLVMLVSFPGLNDHFPADYAYKLEHCLPAKSQGHDS